MDCDTTGIEPDFAREVQEARGGGYFKIINQSVPPAAGPLGYAQWQIDDIVRYCKGRRDAPGVSARTPARSRPRGSRTR